MRLGATSLSITRPLGFRSFLDFGTYVLSSGSNVNEGDTLTVTVNTIGVPSGTVLYWETTNITTSDSDFTTTSGSVQIINGTGAFTVGAVADSTTEGAETFGITLRRSGPTGPIVASTTNKTINDTSQSPPPPSYSASSPSSVNEGSALVCTVTTTNVADGTTLYWTTSHTSTTDADFTANSGSFTITSNSGTFNVTPTADTTTEGSETFTVQIRTGSTSGTIVATLPSVTVNDTSTAATYSFSSASEVDEGSALGCTVTTTGVSNGTTLYWTISHTTTVAADFTSTSGSFTVNSNSGTFSIAIANDTSNENAETFAVQIRTGSTSGTVVETSNSITLNNIYFADAANYSYVRDSAMNTGTNPTYACAISPDGTKFYTIHSGRNLIQQTLSTPYDISTYGSPTTVTLNSTTHPNPVSLFFKPDGTKLFIAQASNGTVVTLSLSTAWDISTQSVDNTFNFNSPTNYGIASVVDFIFSHDGTKCFTVDPSNDRIRRFDLNTAYDLSSGFSASSDISQLLYGTNRSNETSAKYMAFNNNGTKLYLGGSGYDRLQSYDLTTPYDITTSGGFSGNADSLLWIGGQEPASNSCRFSNDGKYFYVTGLNGDDVTQYQR